MAVSAVAVREALGVTQVEPLVTYQSGAMPMVLPEHRTPAVVVVEPTLKTLMHMRVARALL